MGGDVKRNKRKKRLKDQSTIAFPFLVGFACGAGR